MVRVRWACYTLAAALCIVSAQSPAGVITWTGSDLASDPRATFPFGPPTVDGTGAIFGPSADATIVSPKVVRLPLFEAGAIPVGSGATLVSIAANLTRLPCDTTIDCAFSDEDWEPILGLADGVFVVGGTASDSGVGAAVERDDGGIAALAGAGGPLFSVSAFPGFGESIDVAIELLLADSASQITLSFLGESGSTTFARTLDRSRGLEFVLVQDDSGESYRLNRLTISSPALTVPEPSTFGLVLAVLCAFWIGSVSRTSHPFPAKRLFARLKS